MVMIKCLHHPASAWCTRCGCLRTTQGPAKQEAFQVSWYSPKFSDTVGSESLRGYTAWSNVLVIGLEFSVSPTVILCYPSSLTVKFVSYCSPYTWQYNDPYKGRWGSYCSIRQLTWARLSFAPADWQSWQGAVSSRHVYKQRPWIGRISPEPV